MPELERFLDESGCLIGWPSKKPLKAAALRYLGTKFAFGRFYTEKEVNARIGEWHTFGDYFLLRRELIESAILLRERDGSKYWKGDILPRTVDFGGYTLRAVKPEDMPLIADIQRSNSAYAAYSGRVTDDSDARQMVADTPLPPGGFKEFWHVKLLSRPDGGAVGFLQYYLGYPDGGTAFIGAFFLHKEFQRQGIGSAVIDEFASCAKVSGIAALALGVMNENAPGYAFWAKMGFERSGVKSLDEETGKYAEKLTRSL